MQLTDDLLPGLIRQAPVGIKSRDLSPLGVAAAGGSIDFSACKYAVCRF